MSWQAYIDPPSGLLASESCVRGGIYGLDGAVWAQSTGMENVQYQQIIEIKKLFDDPNHGFARGIKIVKNLKLKKF